jgi:cysteine desulfurase
MYSFSLVVFHTDASQSVGKIDVNVIQMGVDLLTLVAHKFYGPKSIGALYVRDDCVLDMPLLVGGGQQKGRRAGTESALLVNAMGVAAMDARLHLRRNEEHMRKMRDLMWLEVSRVFPRALRWTPLEANQALPNTLSVVLDPDMPLMAHELVQTLAPVVLIAAGAACHHGCTTPSATLLALGVSPELAIRTLRISVGVTTEPEEVHAAIKFIRQQMNK